MMAKVPVFHFMTRNVVTITESRTMKQVSKLMYEDNIGSIVILKEGVAPISMTMYLEV